LTPMNGAGLTWPDGVPKGWSLLPFKRLVRIRDGQVDPKLPQISALPLYAPNHIECRTGRLLGLETAAEQGAISGKYPVKRGEIVYSKIRPALRKAMLAPQDGLCSADMYALRPICNNDAKFILYAMLSDGFSVAAELVSDRVAMPKVNRDTLADLLLPTAPVAVQKSVARYLDRKTAAVDALIGKKQKLAELLAENRAAVINQAVTKGLDPAVPMKDSGIAWIGAIPAHWDIAKLPRNWAVIDCKHRTPSYIDEGYPVLSTTEVKPGKVDLAKATRFISRNDYLDMTVGGRKPAPGEIIYSRNASLGAAAYIKTGVEFAMGQDVVLIRSLNQPPTDGLYLSYLLNSSIGMTQVQLFCVGSTFKRINVDQIRKLMVPVPPTEEQDLIARFIENETEQFFLKEDLLQSSIAVLQEYRQAIISAAVTGQLVIPEQGD